MMKFIIGKNTHILSLIKSLILGWILIFVISGCSLAGGDVTQGASNTATSETTTVPSHTKNPTSTPSPSKTPKPTATHTATVTPTSTPTLHPMNILAARESPYPGSLITIEEPLKPGANYDRYIAWYESDGLRIYGLLTVPFGEMPVTGWPAIVFNHGYIAPEAYQTTERYIAYVDLLARNGYIVYKIDYRGHDRSQGDAKGAYSDPGYTSDVLNAVSSLQAFQFADANRIGMWGHSMGGFLTLRAMTISQSINAGVIWSGVVGSYPDLLCCWHHPPPKVPTLSPDPDYHISWRERWENLYGSPQENPEFWMGISANMYLKDLSGPVQLHAGTGDTDVPVKFSQDLYQQIQATGKPVEYYEYAGDNHDLENYFNLAMQRTIGFFDRYLKDGG
jgi:fermentation-respiration switch protein FrsA (DUF1100 family)